MAYEVKIQACVCHAEDVWMHYVHADGRSEDLRGYSAVTLANIINETSGYLWEMRRDWARKLGEGYSVYTYTDPEGSKEYAELVLYSTPEKKKRKVYDVTVNGVTVKSRYVFFERKYVRKEWYGNIFDTEYFSREEALPLVAATEWGHARYSVHDGEWDVTLFQKGEYPQDVQVDICLDTHPERFIREAGLTSVCLDVIRLGHGA